MERLPRNINRREFIRHTTAWLAGASLATDSFAAERPQSETIEATAERRRQIYLELAELIVEKDLAAKIADIQNEYGTAAHDFLTDTGTLQSLELIKQLEQHDFADVVWSNTHGPAAQLEQIYQLHWNATTFERQREQDITPVELKDVANAGFASSEEAEAFFSEGKFFPAGWLQQEVNYIRWKKGTLAGSRKKYAGYTINEKLKPGKTDADAHITIATETSVDGSRPFFIQLATLYHEISHANDWRSAAQPNGAKIELCWKILQRMQSSDAADDSYAKSFTENDDTPPNRWQGAVEYWADISRDYLQFNWMNPADKAVVAWWVELSDKLFDPKKVWIQAATEAIHISLRGLDGTVNNLLGAIPNSAEQAELTRLWEQQRNGFLENKDHQDTVFLEMLDRIGVAANQRQSAEQLATQYNMLYLHVSFKFMFAHTEVDLASF